MSKECCYTDKEDHGHNHGHDHDHHKPKRSYLLIVSLSVILTGYLLHLLLESQIQSIKYLGTFSSSVFELMNRMSWGLALGILFVGLLNKVPREVIQKVMGRSGTISGILRATAGGVLLDLCSHGILLVGMQLYRRGLGLGQTMAFLIASPWNSISLTLILWALVGFKWMISFLLLSMAIAIISGIIFDQLVKRGVLPENPNKVELPKNFSAIKELKKAIKNRDRKKSQIGEILTGGISGSKMILKWIFLGVILASLIRTFISPDQFETLFGPSILGLGLTLIVATVLEVCSEGSTPIAADILTRAGAPGNAFAFLMTGVSTDYTEILALKETTKSWKITFFLPLITLPQVIILAILLN
jgi:hypothetical protein